jgi:hypothetical protein
MLRAIAHRGLEPQGSEVMLETIIFPDVLTKSYGMLCLFAIIVVCRRIQE